jgi:hypothetical protein
VLEFEALATWLLVAAGTAFLALRLQAGHGRALDRVRTGAPVVSNFLPSPGLVWQELVSWAGSMVPSSPGSLPLVKRRLVRAGFRDPLAARFFHGIRAFTTVVFGMGGLIAGWHAYASTAHLALAVVGSAVAGSLAPMQYLLWRIRRRQREIQKALPNVLDLMVVCVESASGSTRPSSRWPGNCWQCTRKCVMSSPS